MLASRKLLQRQSLKAKDALFRTCLEIRSTWSVHILESWRTYSLMKCNSFNNCDRKKWFLPITERFFFSERAYDTRNWSSADKLNLSILLPLPFCFGTAVQYTWVKAEGCVCGCNLYHFFLYAKSHKSVSKPGKFCQILLILRNYD